MRTDIKMLVMDIPESLSWYVTKYGKVGVVTVINSLCNTINEVYLDTPVASTAMNNDINFNEYINVLSKELPLGVFRELSQNSTLPVDFVRLWRALYEDLFTYFHEQGFIGFSITLHTYNDYSLCFLCTPHK